MAKTMKIISIVTVTLTVAFALLHHICEIDVFLPLAITFGTTAYHFVFRLVVGALFDITLQNKVNYNKKWFFVSAREMKLYQKLNVKGWKNKMPTFSPETFDTSKHTWE